MDVHQKDTNCRVLFQTHIGMSLMPKQNGDAERQNWSIFDHVHTVLIDAGLPLSLFAEAVNYIVSTKNHNSTSALTNTTPYEVRFNKKPDLSRLHPFGCKAYVYDHSPKRKKLSP
jgi:hypothetical protein